MNIEQPTAQMPINSKTNFGFPPYTSDKHETIMRQHPIAEIELSQS